MKRCLAKGKVKLQYNTTKDTHQRGWLKCRTLPSVGENEAIRILVRSNHYKKWAVFTKAKISLCYNWGIIPKYIPKRNECHVHQKTGRRMFIATFFIIAPNWKPSACPSAGERTYCPPPTPQKTAQDWEKTAPVCSTRDSHNRCWARRRHRRVYVAWLHVYEAQEHLRVQRGAASGWECTDWKRSLLKCWKYSFLIQVVVKVHIQM